MPKLSSDTKKQIKQLSRDDLEKIVTKFAGRDKFFYGYLTVNFLNPDFGHLDLYDDAKADLEALIEKSFRGRTEAMQQARRITASLKRISEFTKIVKEPRLEIELLTFLVDYQLSLSPIRLGSYYQTYDNKVARMVKKVVDVIVGKLHEDYRLEYYTKVNGYLKTLHQKIPFNKVVQSLPHQVSNEN